MCTIDGKDKLGKVLRASGIEMHRAFVKAWNSAEHILYSSCCIHELVSLHF